MRDQACLAPLGYDCRIPYLSAYDYLITHIESLIRTTLGTSARGLLILDLKEQFHGEIEAITHARRFEGRRASRINRIVEFSYPVDSAKNPMIQLTDLVVYCVKRFLEIECGYRDGLPSEAKTFYAQCYARIDKRVGRKSLVLREEAAFADFNRYLGAVQAKPSVQWRRRYASS